MDMKERCSSKLLIINLYKEQLFTFKKLGIGRRTEHNTLITDRLIEATKKRLAQLSATYDASLTTSAIKWRDKNWENNNGI